MSLDRVPGDDDLRYEALRKANITHVVSALRLPLDKDLFVNYKHHIVELDDVEDENVIEHFAGCNAFIQEGLDAGGGVLVHCAMGKSRSTTLLIAYLLSTHPNLTPSTALTQIRQTRPFAEPNSGFMEQLSLYHDMNCPPTQEALDAHPLYQRWLYQRAVEASVAAGVAPEVGDLRFGDEGTLAPMNLAAEDGTANSHGMVFVMKAIADRDPFSEASRILQRLAGLDRVKSTWRGWATEGDRSS
ncbi:hypothetical protein P7C71_g1204, partial [Lecanoromycetidae sp. Uapishka_2]